MFTPYKEDRQRRIMLQRFVSLGKLLLLVRLFSCILQKVSEVYFWARSSRVLAGSAD